MHVHRGKHASFSVIVFMVLGLVFVWGSDKYGWGKRPAPEVGDTVSCLVASRAISVGEQLGEDNVTSVEMDLDSKEFTCVTSIYVYKGTSFRSDVSEGETIVSSMLGP